MDLVGPLSDTLCLEWGTGFSPGLTEDIVSSDGHQKDCSFMALLPGVSPKEVHEPGGGADSERTELASSESPCSLAIP